MAFENGNFYCIYYAPRSLYVLSAEKGDPFNPNRGGAVTSTLSQQRFGAHAQNYVTSLVHAKGADLDRLLELAQPRPYWHVLDVATGGGHTALKFAPHVARVVASDITPQMLKAAEAHITGKGVRNVEFREARAEHLPFDSNTFDLVTCRIAPHHFDDVGKFVKEAARVVRPGGLVLVQDQVMPEDPLVAGYVEAFEKLRDPSHNHALTESEWRAAFAAAGLTLEHVETLAKSHSFEEWTTTQAVTPSTKACLEALVAGAPPAAVEWLHPCDFGTPEATFVNVHIILAGRKGG
ncbi:MAG TPA: methyltransferase domain-containing protein [Anaerolineae bacterium]|nr:methyltransferase domain-containing protein [Anaerolineae bacterium]HQI87588.1 methyltransferase domain-containing protein [Anaerolineae bacterium]